MRKEDMKFARDTAKRLAEFDQKVHALPGIDTDEAKETLIFQIVESVRRIRFVHEVGKRPISQLRKNPSSEYFDPIRAAISYRLEGNIDEACWLVFLFVHFGKHVKSGYRLIADVYGKFGDGKWTWAEIVKDPTKFRLWLEQHQGNLKSVNGIHRAFGNHRKYQSLDAWKPNGTGAAVESYVKWVQSSGGHAKLYANALTTANGDAEAAFALVYKSMAAVISFGRTARFDYLTMIGKVGLASIQADSVHFDGATGPVSGAKLLFRGEKAAKVTDKSLERLADALAAHLKTDKQVIEDSLCNWQKSPLDPERFRG